MSLFVELIDSGLAVTRRPIFVVLLVYSYIVQTSTDVWDIMNSCRTQNGGIQTFLLYFSRHSERSDRQ